MMSSPFSSCVKNQQSNSHQNQYARAHGQTWLRQVHNEEQGWLPLEEWEARFEAPPPQSQSQPLPSVTGTGRPKSKHKKRQDSPKVQGAHLLQQQHELTTQLTHIVLEVTCQVLHQLEEYFVDRAIASHKATHVLDPELGIAQVAVTFLNNVSAVLLVHRFQHSISKSSNQPNNTKAAYLKQMALEYLADGLQHICEWKQHPQAPDVLGSSHSSSRSSSHYVSAADGSNSQQVFDKLVEFRKFATLQKQIRQQLQQATLHQYGRDQIPRIFQHRQHQLQRTNNVSPNQSTPDSVADPAGASPSLSSSHSSSSSNSQESPVGRAPDTRTLQSIWAKTQANDLIIDHPLLQATGLEPPELPNNTGNPQTREDYDIFRNELLVNLMQTMIQSQLEPLLAHLSLALDELLVLAATTAAKAADQPLRRSRRQRRHAQVQFQKAVTQLVHQWHDLLQTTVAQHVQQALASLGSLLVPPLARTTTVPSTPPSSCALWRPRRTWHGVATEADDEEMDYVFES